MPSKFVYANLLNALASLSLNFGLTAADLGEVLAAIAEALQEHERRLLELERLHPPPPPPETNDPFPGPNPSPNPDPPT